LSTIRTCQSGAHNVKHSSVPKLRGHFQQTKSTAVDPLLPKFAICDGLLPVMWLEKLDNCISAALV
jgi:hypothetical protein